jgi:hypothetical protein
MLNDGGSNLKMLQNSLMVTTSSMLMAEGEGMLAWLTDLQMMVVMTGQGWTQIEVRKEILVLVIFITNYSLEPH